MRGKEDSSFLDNGWLKLDNAAKIYPPVINRDLSSVFRIGCKLSSPVKVSALQNAIDETCKRFPYYLTTLRRGLFWYFLEYDKDIRPPLLGEDERPCIAFPAQKSHNALFRIIVYDNRLSAEFLHILTDGSGALGFFRSLIVTYLRKCNLDIPYSEGIIDPSSKVEKEESEDSFNKYFRSNIPPPARLENAWHLAFESLPGNRLNVTCAEINANELKIVAKKNKVSITEYLASVYIFCLKGIWNDSRLRSGKIIRVEVPVNLRATYPSRTMRNFSLFVMPGIDMRLGDYSFPEILRLVHNYMQTETDIKVISRIIARNVKPERNLFVRIIPLFVKDIFLSIAFKRHGASKYSGVLSNLGVVRMPEEAHMHIESFYIIPPPPTKDLKVSCGVVTYHNRLIMTFANITGSLDLERRICSYLASGGIKVKILN